MVGKRRYVISYDGSKYHVRRLASLVHDWGDDSKLYTCDLPIASDLPSVYAAAEIAEKWRKTGALPKRSTGGK